MKLIKLSKGKSAIVDDDDFDRVNQYKWHYHTAGYAVRKPWKGQNIFMHRFILGATQGQEVDHINRDRLDNRKDNLRFCTRQENCHNSGRKNGKSGYKGVNKNGSRWRASIMFGYKNHHLGYWDTPELAYEAYKKAAKFFGVYVKT